MARLLLPPATALVLGVAACTATATPAGGTGRITSGGIERTFAVHVPPSRPASLPVLLVFHGAGGTGSDMQGLGFNAWADSLGFLAVYPDAAPGTRGTWALGCNQCTWADVAGVDDYRFTQDLIDSLAARYPVDRARLFATGHSLGGSFAFDLACHVPGLFAGTAVSSSLPSMEELPLCTTGQMPLRVITSAGTSDANVPWNGGPGGSGATYQGAESTASYWAARGSCESTPARRDLPDQNHDGEVVHVVEYTACAGGGFVRFFKVDGMGHSWPAIADLDLTREIANSFFTR